MYETLFAASHWKNPKAGVIYSLVLPKSSTIVLFYWSEYMWESPHATKIRQIQPVNGVRGWRGRRPFSPSPDGVKLFSQSVPSVPEKSSTSAVWPPGNPVFYVRLKVGVSKRPTYLRVEENGIVKPMCQRPATSDVHQVTAAVSSSDVFDFPEDLAGFSETLVGWQHGEEAYELPTPKLLSSEYVEENCAGKGQCVAVVVEQNGRIGLRTIMKLEDTDRHTKALIDFGNFWSKFQFRNLQRKYSCKRFRSVTLDMTQTVLNAFPYHNPPGLGYSSCTALYIPEEDGTLSVLDDAFWSDDTRLTRGVRTGYELTMVMPQELPCKVKLTKKANRNGGGYLTDELRVVLKRVPFWRRCWAADTQECTAIFDGPLATPAIMAEGHSLSVRRPGVDLREESVVAAPRISRSCFNLIARILDN